MHFCLPKLFLGLSLLLVNSFIPLNASQIEQQLRTSLLTDYNKYTRPVERFNDTLDVTIGLAVQNIESFNQIEETIQLNIWLRKYWQNSLLKWNTSEYQITQLTLDNNEVWTPDIELINAATKPDVYTLKGGMYLYSDGSMLWSMPTVYKFSCALELHDFPFDTQDCFLRFGSWTYDNTLLTLSPHGAVDTQIDVLESFSHSEWNLEDYYVKNYNQTRDCCGDLLFDINEYHFLLSRYTHYYKLNMGMTISLVVVSFIIMLIKPDNLSRTGTAVFIPLTILALQLTIADKIPVVGYYTLMDQFFLTCFITSMIVSIESGIVYTFITSKSSMIFSIFDRVVDYTNIIKRLRQEKINRINERNNHEDFIRLKKQTTLPIVELELENESNCQNSQNKSSQNVDELEYFDEFGTVINALSNTESNKVSNKESNTNLESGEVVELQSTIRKRRQRKIDNINQEMRNDNEVVSKNVVKVIQFDDKNLSLTYKEFLLFNEVSRIFIVVDNVFRIILPFTFFVIIGVIFSNEN
jgi:hypothetical protein